MSKARVKTGIVLLILMSFIYYLPIPIIILRLALWIPIFYDLMYILSCSRSQHSLHLVILMLYAALGTEVMLIYYPNPILKHQGTIIILIVTLSDILQYVCGKYFGTTQTGGPSPKKTWEGYSGVLITCLCFWYWVPLRQCLIWALCGVAGDLFESWCKRNLGIKDSSDLLGEHGGWLDRLDGIFMALIISRVYLG